MKNLGYNLLLNWVKAGLYCYYSEIRISGKENIPKDKPVMFLPNHQNALLDVLLVGVDCNRKPWFLTRSDVFKKPILKKFFTYLQMIPIYRIRDGRESLKQNEAVFKRCAALLENKEAILMFPEGNHSLKRIVRPLSKGFTRILFSALEQSPELDIQLVPVGLNYKDAENFPDKVAINFGEPIAVLNFYNVSDINTSTIKVKEAVVASLKTLTTHIEDEETYEQTIKNLDARGVDYSNLEEVQAALQNRTIVQKTTRSTSTILGRMGKAVYTILNLPILLFWRTFGKRKVWEPEFMGTLRFAFALLVYPIYYLLVFTIVALVWNSLIALGVALGLFVFNWCYTKLGST